MGKRKSKARVMKKVVQTVATVFDCPFCNHQKTVTCQINRNAKLGEVRCRVCDVKYQTSVTSLSQPIDVYSEWIDECERVNELSRRERQTAGSDSGLGSEDEEEGDRERRPAQAAAGGDEDDDY